MLGWLEGGRHFLLSLVWKKHPPQLGLGLRSTLGGNNLYKPQIPEPKVFLDLYHPNIIPFLLSFFFFFFQLSLQSPHLLLSYRKLVFSLAQLLALGLFLSLSTFQGHLDTLFLSNSLGQLGIKILDLLLG